MGGSAKCEGPGSEKNRPAIGGLVLVVPRAGDENGHPALGTSYLHRKAAASLAGDAYLDLTRDYFSYLQNQLSVRLSHRRMSVEEWYEPVANIAREAGLLWAVAMRGPETTLGPYDSPAIAKIVEEVEDERDISTAYRDGGVVLRTRRLASTVQGAAHVIECRVPGSGFAVLMGVERTGFGDELSFASPWRNFLLDLAQIADAALSRVIFAIELQRRQFEAAQYQGLATTAVTTGTIVHQLSNFAHGHAASVSVLLDALAAEKLTTSEEIHELLESMKRSSDRMRAVLSAITGLTKTDDRRPSDLREAALQAGTLFEAFLLQRKISLDIVVPSGILLDIPLSVAALSIANVIGNAKDAMPGGGAIRVEAADTGDMVLCRIVDQGPGIPDDIKERIFDIGFSTKNGQGSGWGLYLTKRSLTENRSNIELTETGESGSTFTICFPSAKKEGPWSTGGSSEKPTN
jgi:signal transduction histidine kinase